MSAWTWDCPSCGKRNFTNDVEVNLTEEELKEIGLPQGTIAVAPDEVTCANCLNSYITD